MPRKAQDDGDAYKTPARESGHIPISARHKLSTHAGAGYGRSRNIHEGEGARDTLSGISVNPGQLPAFAGPDIENQTRAWGPVPLAYMNGLPRTSMAFSTRISTPIPASAPTWVCSRGNNCPKDSFANRASFMQLDRTKKAQETRFQYSIALRLEVGVHHAHALVVAKIFEHGAL